MIGGAAEILAEKLKILDEDPATIVIQVQGSAAAPSLLVVETDPSHAEELQRLLGEAVAIERNFPIEPF